MPTRLTGVEIVVVEIKVASLAGEASPQIGARKGTTMLLLSQRVSFLQGVTNNGTHARDVVLKRPGRW